MRLRHGAAGVLLLAAALAPRPAYAAWPTTPDQSLAVCTAAGLQFGQVQIPDGAGGTFIAWEDFRSGTFAVYLTRIAASGAIAPGWPVNGLAMPGPGLSQRMPALVASGDGCIVAWADSRAGNADIYAMKLNGDATPGSGWPALGLRLSTSALEENLPRIASDGASGAYVVWKQVVTFTNGDIYASRALVTGAIAAGFPAAGLAIATTADNQTEPVVAAESAGRALVAWSDRRGSGGTHLSVYGQSIRSSGAFNWTAGGLALADNLGGDARTPALLGDGSGGGVVAFSVDDVGFATFDIRVQHFGSNGTALWGAGGVAFVQLPNERRYPVIVSVGANGWIVAWEDYRDGVQNPAIYAQRVFPGGGPAWALDGVRLHAGVGNTQLPEIVADGAGGAIVTWDGALPADGDTRRVRAQRMSALGTPLWGPDGTLVSLAADAARPTLAGDGLGGAILAWTDPRNFTDGSPDVFAQRVDSFGALGDVTPAITRVADVPNDQGGAVTLQWSASEYDRFPDGVVTNYSLWRRVPGGTAPPAGTVVVPWSEPAAAAAPRPWRASVEGAQVVFWEFVGDRPAAALPGYSAVVSTTSDSMPGANPFTSFRVRAENDGPRAWWDSAPDSGYSIDNVAPPTPSPFTGTYAGGTSVLQWPGATVADFETFVLYRGTTPGFVPGPATLVVASPQAGWVDAAGQPYWYKLAAVDVHGNTSAYALLLPSGTLAAEPGAPLAFACSPAQPTPARGPVAFALALPRAADVRLDIFDAGGRRVRTVPTVRLATGRHALAWDARDDGGAPARPGLYFARIDAAPFTAMRRIVLAR